MNKLLALTICILITSSISLAQETDTCVNNAGIVVTGIISKHKYCMSNQKMDFWNAYTWCDAQGRKLFILDNCECSVERNCINRCPEVAYLLGENAKDCYFWTATQRSEQHPYSVYLPYSYTEHSWHTKKHLNHALCY